MIVWAKWYKQLTSEANRYQNLALVINKNIDLALLIPKVMLGSNVYRTLPFVNEVAELMMKLFDKVS